MGSDLKQSHKDMVESYLSNKDNKIYMLTIARDGEDPVRSILFYQNSIEAAAAYNKYTDWGFAKNYLTVCLYEPSGIINKKVLKRDQSGECTFVKQDYIKATEIIKSVKSRVDSEVYEEIGLKFMRLFAKDNWRFDPNRFLKNLEIDNKYEEN
jgi:hypothetical protein